MLSILRQAVQKSCMVQQKLIVNTRLTRSKNILPVFKRHIHWSFYMSSQSEDAAETGIKMKLDTPQFYKLFTPELKQLAEIFRRNGYELRIAGGAVRDLLMGLQPQDIDFATTATPDQMKEMFNQDGVRMINMKGESHGTITARLNEKENFEVTTLRVDLVTDGRHAEVEFTTDWKIDAERRDLTINSMFLGLDGTLYDFFGGKEDLEKRKVAFVGNPTSRIQEDYLRIIRYFRFYGRIAVDPNAHCPKTLEAIKENGQGLAQVAGERIWVEMKKILLGNHAASIMETMHELELFQFLGIPRDCNISDFRVIWNRTRGLEPLPMTLLSSLFRDQPDILLWHDRVKPSADERKLSSFIVEHRTEGSIQELLKRYQTLILSNQNKEKKILDYTYELVKYQGDSDLLAQLREWDIPKFPVNGKDLMDRGMKKGRRVGKILDHLKEIWIENECKPTKEELLEKLPEIQEKIMQR